MSNRRRDILTLLLIAGALSGAATMAQDRIAMFTAGAFDLCGVIWILVTARGRS